MASLSGSLLDEKGKEKMGRDENVIIFRDTEKMCNENKRLKDSVMRSKRSQKLILDGEKLSDINRSRYEEMANIIVSKKRTFLVEGLRKVLERRKSVCVDALLYMKC